MFIFVKKCSKGSNLTPMLELLIENVKLDKLFIHSSIGDVSSTSNNFMLEVPLFVYQSADCSFLSIQYTSSSSSDTISLNLATINICV